MPIKGCVNCSNYYNEIVCKECIAHYLESMKKTQTNHLGNGDWGSRFVAKEREY
jgi:hypothetical protein